MNKWKLIPPTLSNRPNPPHRHIHTHVHTRTHTDKNFERKHLNSKLTWWQCGYQLMFRMSWVFKSLYQNSLFKFQWRNQTCAKRKGLTVWRRHKPLRAAQTAAAPEWRWPTRCSLHPAWSLQLPLRLEHKHGGWNNLKWRAWTWQETTTRPQTVRGWQTQVSATGYYINTNTRMDECAQWLGQADVCWHRHRTHRGGEVLFILWTVWRRQAACGLLQPGWAHRTTHTDRLTFQSMVAKAVMGGCKKSLCQSGRNR